MTLSSSKVAIGCFCSESIFSDVHTQSVSHFTHAFTFYLFIYFNFTVGLIEMCSFCRNEDTVSSCLETIAMKDKPVISYLTLFCNDVLGYIAVLV